MDGGDPKNGESPEEVKQRQKYLHKTMTEQEEAYHSAYPNVRYPYLSSIFVGIFSRGGRGALAWFAVGIIVIAIVWAIYAMWVH